MAAYAIKNAAGDTIYIDTASGAGTLGNPFVSRAFVFSDDFDIRDLSHTTDSVAVVQSGVWNVTVSNFPANQTVTVASGELAVSVPDGLEVTNLPNTYPITDNNGSITIDGAVSISGGSIAVSNQPAVYPITDNGESITVDGGVTVSGNVGVSGTVTANLGTIGSAATESTLAGLVSELQNKPDGTILEPLVTRGKMRSYRFNPTVTSGTAYAQYDSIGSLLTLNNAVSASGRGTFLHSVQSNSVVSAGISTVRLLFFDANPTLSTFTNDAAIVLNFDDQEKIAAVVEIGTPYQIDSNTFSANQATTAPLPKAMLPVASGIALYCAIQAGGSITFNGANDLDLTLTFYEE
jgi:hypothetical protein